MPAMTVVRACVAVATLAAAQAGFASEDHVTARELQEAGRILSLDEILDRVKTQYPGKILEAELHRSDHGYRYEIEFLDRHGRVRELNFDAQTGEIVDAGRER